MANIAAPLNPMQMAAVDPEYQAQQAQAQRNYALAQAMRQQSMEDSTAPGGGRVSWTQGVARLAQALSANVLNSRADKQSIAFGRALGTAVNGNFGIAPTGNPAPANSRPNAPPPQALAAGLRGNTSAPQQAQSPAVAPSAGNTTGDALVPSAGYAPGAQIPSDRSAPLPNANSAPANAPPVQASQASGNGMLSAQPPMSSPSQSSQQPMQASASSSQQSTPQTAPPRAPWALTGDPYRDRAKWLLGGDEYAKAVIANDQKASAMTDGEILINHARQAEANGDHATASSLAQQAFKLGYIPEVSHRGGSWGSNPMTGALQFYPNAPVNGAVPTTDKNGQMSWALPTGTTGVISDAHQAEATGKGIGSVPYETTKLKDKDGNEYTVATSTLHGIGTPIGGAPAASPGGVAPPGGRGAGTLEQNYGAPALSGGPSSNGGPSGNLSDIGPGTVSANKQAGENSANNFQRFQMGGAQAADTQRLLSQLEEAGKGLNTGALGPQILHFKSAVNSVVPGTFDPNHIAKFDEVQKLSAQLASQMAGESGGPKGTTDAQLANSTNAIANGHYSPQAFQNVLDGWHGRIAGKQASNQMSAQWQQQHGSNSWTAFDNAYQHAYNPDIFFYKQQGDKAFTNWTNSLPPAQARHILQQYQTMRSMGAF